MKKRLIVLVSSLTLILLVTLLSGCTSECDHKFKDEWTSDEFSHWHACTNEECKTKKDSESHVWGDAVVTTEPTCKDAGVTTYTCGSCGKTYTEEIAKLTTHNFVEGVCTVCEGSDPDYCAHTNKTEVNTATCSTDGKHYFDCDNCDAIFDETDVAAFGHKYTDGVCSACNGVITYFVNSGSWETVCAYAWPSNPSTWPGEAMTKSDATVNGFDVYYIEYPQADTNIIFNCGSNAAQTSDLEYKVGKYYNFADQTWYDSLDSISQENPDSGETPSEPSDVETVTIYFVNNWLWTEVNCHYWGAASISETAWPGVAMTKVGTSDQYDVYAVEVPADVAGLLFNGLDNGTFKQTSNITDGIVDGAAWTMDWNSEEGDHVDSTTYNPNGGNEEPDTPDTPAAPDFVFYPEENTGYTVDGLNIKYNGIGNSYKPVTAEVSGLALGKNTFTVTITNNGSTVSRVRFDIQGTTWVATGEGSGTDACNVSAVGGDVWTDLTWGGSALTVPAGESVTLTITFDGEGEHGAVKNLLVYVDSARGDKENYNSDITLSGLAFSKVEAEKPEELPGQKLNFKGDDVYTITPFDTATSSVNIKYTGISTNTYKNVNSWIEGLATGYNTVSFVIRNNGSESVYVTSKLEKSGAGLVEVKTYVAAGEEATVTLTYNGDPNLLLFFVDSGWAETTTAHSGDITVYGVEFKTVQPQTPVETVTVYFVNNWKWTDVCCYYWVGENNNSWPGTAMTKVGTSGQDDVYAVEVPANVDGIIFNGVMNDGSGKLDQSPDIKTGIVDGAGWKMDWVDNKNAVAEFTYNSDPEGGEGNEPDTPVVPDTPACTNHTYVDGVCSTEGCNYVIIYFVNSAKWESVYAYAWTGDDFNTAWPGLQMIKTEYTVNDFDVYSVEIDGSYAEIIFNCGSSSAQTGNLIFTPGKFFYLHNGSWYGSLDEVPELNPLATDNYLVGAFNGWSTVTDEFILKTEGGTVGYVAIELEANTTYEFKIVKSGAWLGCDATITDSIVDYNFYGSELSNAKITTKFAGLYVFAFDSNGDKLSITFFDPCAEGHSYSDATCTAPKTCSKCGTTEGEALGHNYVEGVCGNCNENDPEYCAHESKTLVNTATCTEAGKIYLDCDHCDAIFDEKDSEPLGHTYDKYGKCSVCSGGDTYTVAGVEELCGSYWNKDDINNTLLYNAETGVYTIVYTNVKAGTYMIKVLKNNSWDGAFGGDAEQGNYAFEVADDNCTVTITVSSEGMKVSFSYAAKTYYLVPGAWDVDGAWYAVYCFNSDLQTNEWIKMEKVDGHNYYTAIIPAGYTNVIFVRFNPEFNEMRWNTEEEKDAEVKPVWGQTADLEIKAGADTYYIADWEAHEWHTHSYEVVVTAPTCVAQGYTTHSCSCGDSYVTDTTPIASHNYSHSVTAPDCTNKGYTTHTCGGCGDSYVDTYIDALGHTEVADEAKAPTCTVDGLTAGSHCSVCNAPIVAQQPIPATGHSFGEWYVHAEPTETKEGEKRRDCSVCGGYESSPIGALGHTHTPVVLPGKAPTCTEPGVSEGQWCPACQEILVAQNTISAAGHTEVILPAKPATCTATGLTEGKECSVCHTVLVKQQIVGVSGHTEVVDAAKAPTCTEDGLTAGRHCDVCGTVTLEQKVDPALGHNVVTDAAKAPTCTESGLTAGKHCTRCDAETVAQQTVPATGHSYNNGACACGAKDPDYVAPHEHKFENGECACGEKDPNYVPPHVHEFVEGKCECGESDPDYVAPEQPAPNFFEAIIAAILAFFASIGDFFKGLFSK